MNKWKRAFLILLGADVLIILAMVLALIFMSSGPESVPPQMDAKLQASPVFTVSTDKNQITKVINSEISKHPTGNLTFHVEMGKTLDIIGDLKLFGLGIPFTMNFSPAVDKQGNIVLKEKDVKLGGFNLPESQVLKFIKVGANLPSWVYVYPNQKEIYIDLNSVVIKDRFYLKAEEIDIPKNKIIFHMFRKPVEKK